MANTKTSVLGPGAELKQAREAAGKSVEDVAAYLRLTTQVVQSLEADQYQDRKHAIPFTFVRGYLRSYAKFLQLDADKVVASFNQLNLHEPRTDRPVLGMTRRPLSFKAPNIRWLSYGMIGLGLLLTIMWWRGHNAIVQQPTDQSPWVEVETNINTPNAMVKESGTTKKTA